MTSLLSCPVVGLCGPRLQSSVLPILQEESGGGPWIPRIGSTRASQWDSERCQPTVRLTLFVQEDNARILGPGVSWCYWMESVSQCEPRFLRSLPRLLGGWSPRLEALKQVRILIKGSDFGRGVT
ncbi:hypothetical protein BDV11DRAFT_200264 [Aspergillus similis]